MSITRRQFLQRASVAAAAVSAPMVLSSRVFGANDTIRVAVVGLGHRGVDFHIPCMEEQEGVKVVALCDPDRSRLARRHQGIREKIPPHARPVRRHAHAVGPQGYRRALPRHADLLALSWARSGPARPASTFTWRSRSRSTSGKAGRWSTPRGNTIASCSAAPRSVRSAARARPSSGSGPATSARSS